MPTCASVRCECTRAVGTNLNESWHRTLNQRRPKNAGTFLRTLVWLSIFVLQANYAKLYKRGVRQRRTLDDVHAGAFHLPVAAATRSSRRMWLGYERTELTDTELQEQGFTVGKPRQRWSDEQKRCLFAGLLAAAVEPVLPDQRAYRYLVHHHLVPNGHVKTEIQVKAAVRSINRKAPGWEQVPEDVQRSAAQQIQREAQQAPEEEGKSERDGKHEHDNLDLKELEEDGDDDEEDCEDDEEENTSDDTEEKKQALSSSVEPSSPTSPVPPVPFSECGKFGSAYQPKAAVYVRGSFMDQAYLLQRGGICRSPKGRTDSYLTLRDIEHKVPAPTAVTGGIAVARRLFAPPKHVSSPPRVVSVSSRPSRVVSMSLPVAPAPAEASVCSVPASSLPFLYNIVPLQITPERDAAIENRMLLLRGVAMSQRDEKWRTDEVLTRRLAAAGRELRPLALVGDQGACLYWAICDQMVVERLPLPGSGGQWSIIPDDVWRVDWDLRERHWRVVKTLTLRALSESPQWMEMTSVGLDEPLSALRPDHAFGNDICVWAACEALRVNMEIFSDRADASVSNNYWPWHCPKRRAAADKKPKLVLVNWDKRHYSSTRICM